MTTVDPRIVEAMESPEIRTQVLAVIKSVADRILRLPRRRRRSPVDEKILRVVSAYFDIDIKKLRGPLRVPVVAHARMIAYWLMRQQGMSFPQIGQAVGGRHHSTVMYGVGLVEACPVLLTVATSLAKEIR